MGVLLTLLPYTTTFAAAPGTWSTTGSMHTARTFHTATLLSDGRVLVAGGGTSRPEDGSFGGPVASAELYNPRTGTWSPTGAMNAPHFQHTATLLRNGNVLVVGGSSGAAYASATAELYDPNTGRWTLTGDMHAARTLHATTLLAHGKVLVSGGADAPGCCLLVHASAELYDPRTGRWTPTGSLSTARFAHTSTLLKDGRVLVAGGQPNTATAETYDPSKGVWGATGSMIASREAQRALGLTSGRVLVAGGITGGAAGTPTLTSAELYDPGAGVWSGTGSMVQGHARHTMTLLLDGRVLVTGGYLHESGAVLASAEVYEPASAHWSAAGSMSTTRGDHTSTLLLDGRVLVVGGSHTSIGPFPFLASAEIYTAGVNRKGCVLKLHEQCADADLHGHDLSQFDLDHADLRFWERAT